MSASIRIVLPLAAAILLPAAALAQLPRMKVALDLDANRSQYSDKVSADSVERRVLAFLVPAVEAQGFEVVRVQDWRDATRSGRYEAVVRLEVDARPVVLIRNAWVMDKDDAPTPQPRPTMDERKAVHTDESRSVEAWARWKAWDGRTRKESGSGDIPRLIARVEGQGDGASLDDEENVARLLADELSRSILPALEFAVTPVVLVPR
jgi:hypothetical protein